MLDLVQFICWFWLMILGVVAVIVAWRLLLIVIGVPLLCLLPFTQFTIFDQVSQSIKKDIGLSLIIAMLVAYALVNIVVVGRLIKRFLK